MNLFTHTLHNYRLRILGIISGSRLSLTFVSLSGFFFAGVTFVALLLQEFSLAIISLIGSILLVSQVLLTHKIGQIDNIIKSNLTSVCDALKNQSLTEYRQLEAFIVITKLLDLSAPLPQLRHWAASPDFLALTLNLILKADKNEIVIIECGSGSSTIIMGLALKQKNRGRLIAIEHNAKYAADTLENIKLHSLVSNVDVLVCPLVDCTIGTEHHLWYDIGNIFSNITCDFLIIDGPPADTTYARYPALPLLSGTFKESTLIILDDGARLEETTTVSRWRDEDRVNNIRYFETEKGAYVLSPRI